MLFLSLLGQRLSKNELRKKGFTLTPKKCSVKHREGVAQAVVEHKAPGHNTSAVRKQTEMADLSTDISRHG